MAITYEKIKEQIVENSEIDITVQFTNDNEITLIKMFRFKDQAELDNNFIARMTKAIINYEDRRERSITPHEIIRKLESYFQTNTSLSRSQAANYMQSRIIVKGAF